MSERKDRVVSLIKELAATFVQHEANTDPLITITGIDLSPDLKNATILFTTLPEGREADAEIFLKRSASDMRRHIKKHANLKFIPNLNFRLDVGERHRQNIDRIASELQAAKKSHENNEDWGTEP